MKTITLINKFLISKRGAGRKASTIESYKYRLETFCMWCADNDHAESDLLGVTGAETIELYMSFRRDNKCSPHTIAGDYRSIRAFYKWLVRRGEIERDDYPFQFLTQPKTPKELPKSITKGDFSKIRTYLAGIDDWTARRDECIFFLMGYCGFRVSEITDLTIGDIDIDDRVMRVYRHKTDTDSLIPFIGPAEQPLIDWLTLHRPKRVDYMWPISHRSGKPRDAGISVAGVREMCRRRCIEADCTQIWFPHAFRHFCGVNLAKLGASPRFVQDMLGHTDARSTEKYMRYRVNDLLEEANHIYSRH